MHIKIKAELAKNIDNALSKFHEEPEWPVYCVPENLVELMTNSAEIIFDAAVAASKLTEEQNE